MACGMFSIQSEARLRRFRASMENRFGVKDFFLFALLILLLITVGLAMKQFDRQYQQILDLRQKSEEHTRDLVEIRRTLAQGLTVSSPSANAGGTPSTNPVA